MPRAWASAAREFMRQSYRAWAVPEFSIDEPERHHQAEVLSGFRPVFRLDCRRTLRRLERQADLIRRHVAQDLEQVGGVEADVERITREPDRKLVLGLTEVRRLHAELQHRCIEGHADPMRLI